LAQPKDLTFLVDVDNTLLDNDRVQDDIRRHLETSYGPDCRDRYWAILEELLSICPDRHRGKPAVGAFYR
jgi:hypothetical protein